MDRLERIRELLIEGDRELAFKELSDYLLQNPRSNEAWWLMFAAVEERKQKMDCIEQILQIDPQDLRAQRLLAALKDRPSLKLEDLNYLITHNATTASEIISEISQLEQDTEIMYGQDGKPHVLDRIPEGDRIHCPHCEAVIAKGASRCEWCGKPVAGE